MKIIIEEYQYAVEDVKDILWEGTFQTVDGKVSINYVGYYFNPRQGVNDCVFILPKVLLEVGSDKVERVFGKYLPKDIVITDEPDKDVFYIGDSKYYKLGNPVGRESVYKQFTCARNVIQWNLNLFLDNPDQEAQEGLKAFGKYGKLRDDITEGYNVILNFFISARMLYDASGKLSYADNIELSRRDKTIFNSRQFENRLFDRDTLLVAHYDVNFLFVVSLYARDSISQRSAWKSKVRRMFREKIPEMLKDKFEFYAMTPRAETDPEQFLRDNFTPRHNTIITATFLKKRSLLAILICRDCWQTSAVNKVHPSSSAHRFISRAASSSHIGTNKRCRTN